MFLYRTQSGECQPMKGNETCFEFKKVHGACSCKTTRWWRWSLEAWRKFLPFFWVRCVWKLETRHGCEHDFVLFVPVALFILNVLVERFPHWCFFCRIVSPLDGKPPRRSQFLSDSLVARIALLTENLQGLVAAQSSRTWIFMFVACKNLDRL